VQVECSTNYGQGGWWYNGCAFFQPTGLNLPGSINPKGIYYGYAPGYSNRYSFPEVMFIA